MDIQIPTKAEQQAYMEHALAAARIACAHDEVPVGAVVVSPDGSIIARAANKTRERYTQTAHAEIQAISQAGKHTKNWRLLGCWVYVTLQPCAMCMHALYLSRVAGVVYGAESPLYGFHLDNSIPLCVYQKGVVHIIAGVRRDEAARLLRDFFEKKRKRSSVYGSGPFCD